MAQGVFPALGLTPAPGGLFSVADVTEHSSDGQWANGPFGWDSDACPVELVATDFCATAKQSPISDAVGSQNESWPFGVIAIYECLTVGRKPEERRDIAVRQLKAGSQKGVEHELWTGDLAKAAGHEDSFLSLSDIQATHTLPAAANPAHGIAALEQAIVDCGLGTQGVIHLTRTVASLASALGALWMDDEGVLRTRLGTPVVAGAGYKAPASGAHWAYATGPLAVHLGPAEFIGENLDIKTNVLQTIAGRSAAVYWDACCGAAVQITP